MKTFTQLVANVGIRVGDTSTAFATIIGQYVNYRYAEIYERYNWGTINPSYTVTTTGGIQDYKLANDFGKALYIYDTTLKQDIPQRNFADLETNQPAILGSSQTPLMVAIFEQLNADTPTPTGVIEKWIRFSPIPTAAIVYNVPYFLWPSDMSGTNIPILDCDYEVELGATADAWRTKRQFAKAQDFDRQYEEHIQHMIWRRENEPNKVTQFSPRTFDIDNNLY